MLDGFGFEIGATLSLASCRRMRLKGLVRCEWTAAFLQLIGLPAAPSALSPAPLDRRGLGTQVEPGAGGHPVERTVRASRTGLAKDSADPSAPESAVQRHLSPPSIDGAWGDGTKAAGIWGIA